MEDINLTDFIFVNANKRERENSDDYDDGVCFSVSGQTINCTFEEDVWPETSKVSQIIFHFGCVMELHYTLSVKTNITSSEQRSLKSTTSKLIIFWHR